MLGSEGEVYFVLHTFVFSVISFARHLVRYAVVRLSFCLSFGIEPSHSFQPWLCPSSQRAHFVFSFQFCEAKPSEAETLIPRYNKDEIQVDASKHDLQFFNFVTVCESFCPRRCSEVG